MRALTLHRPWPYVILRRGKRVENRTWLPHKSVIGQRIALHAGKGWDARAEEYITRDPDRAMRWPALVEAEGIVGTAVVLGWVNGAAPWPAGEVPWYPPAGEVPWYPSSAKSHRFGPETLSEDLALDAIRSPYYFGPIGWVLDDVQELPAPIPHSGFHRGLWEVPEELFL